MNINLRLAVTGDVKRLTDHVVKFYQDPEEFCRMRIAYSIQNNFIVLAEDLNVPNSVAGKLIFQAKENPKLGVGEFEAFEIHPDYQGRKIGSMLFERSIEEAHEYFGRHDTKMRWLYLETRSNNKAAKNLYKKFGFKEGPLLGKVFTDDEPPEQYMYRSFG